MLRFTRSILARCRRILVAPPPPEEREPALERRLKELAQESFGPTIFAPDDHAGGVCMNGTAGGEQSKSGRDESGTLRVAS